MSRSIAVEVDQAVRPRLAAEEDVLGDGALGQQVELLEDRRDPGLLGLHGVAEGHRARRRARRCPRRAGGRRRGSSSASTCRRRSRPTRPCTSPARSSRSTSCEHGVAEEALGDPAGAEHDVARCRRAGRRSSSWWWRRTASRRHCDTRHALLSRGRQKFLAGRAEVVGGSLLAVHAGDLFELLRDGRPGRAPSSPRPPGLARSTIAARIDVLMRLEPGGAVRRRPSRPAAARRRSSPSTPPPGSWSASTSAPPTPAPPSPTWPATDPRRASRRDLDVATGPEEVLGWVGVGDRARCSPSSGATPDELWRPSASACPGPVEHSTGRADQPADHAGLGPLRRARRTCSAPSTCRCSSTTTSTSWRSASSRPHLPDVDDLVFIKVATGIGAGSSPAAALQRGAQGTAGDLGHVRVPRRRRRHLPLRQQGCLEAVAAGPALAARAPRGGRAGRGRPRRRRPGARRRPRRRSRPSARPAATSARCSPRWST